MSPSNPNQKRKKNSVRKLKKVVPSKPSGPPPPQARPPTRTVSPVVLARLKEFYPDAHCELNFQTPFQLLIATILSAQCTDVRVNLVTEVLFKDYGTANNLSVAKAETIESVIRPAGFYRAKTKNILSVARTLVEKYQGEVPRTLEELTALPGVGRKTANVVLGNAFAIASGVVVDTHVTRLSHRLGYSWEISPEKIEMDLERQIPTEDWILFSHLLIFHGRRICKARNPGCEICFLVDLCPSAGVK